MKTEPADTVEWGTSDSATPPFFVDSTTRVRAEFGACSHPGKVRPNNEDGYAVIRRRRSREWLLSNMPPEDRQAEDDETYVLVVADGMGGAAFGEIASRLALRTGEELAGRACSWVMKLRDVDSQQVKERVQAYAASIHQALLEAAAYDPRLAGMGTTLTCAYVMGADVVFAHIGDSRAYHYRQGQIEQVTCDHTLAQSLIDAGMPREDTRAYRHMLTNCLGGQSPDVRADVYHIQLETGDCVLLCTDGLTDLITDTELAEVLEFYASPQAACDRLLELALERGARDNITVVIGRFEVLADESASER